MQRLTVKAMLLKWEQEFPGRIEAIFSSICNVSGSQLADPKLFDFGALEGRRIEPMSDADEAAARSRTRDGASLKCVSSDGPERDPLPGKGCRTISC